MIGKEGFEKIDEELKYSLNLCVCLVVWSRELILVKRDSD